MLQKFIPALKTETEIEKMRVAGRIAAQTLEMISQHIKQGISTLEIDKLCHDFIRDHGANSACIGHGGYKHTTCTSVNHVVCHGIPNHKQLKNGDIINVDLVVEKDGYHGDTSETFIVGKASILAKRLVKTTQECLYIAINAVKPGAHLGDIGAVIQSHAEKNRFSIVRDFCGHGIGQQMHEEPEVLHYGQFGKGLELIVGMTFTIEPMLNVGSRHVSVLSDGWTAVTKDRRLSAQFEHTLLVTNIGCEVLTLRAGEKIIV